MGSVLSLAGGVVEAPSPSMQGFGAVCERYGGELVDAADFYREVFPPDTIEPRRRAGTDPAGHNGNPLLLIQRKEAGSYRHTKRILFQDYEWLTKWRSLSKVRSVWMSGLTYIGKTRNLAHAVAMHAMIFDIDAVSPAGLENLLYGTATDVGGFYPFPNYITLSGHGVHLYYVFAEPIPLYHGKYGRKVKSQVNALKMALTRELWNPYTIDNYAKGHTPQYQGINQAFRIVGSPTKVLDDGKRHKVIAYKFSQKPYEGLQALYQYVNIPKEEQYRERSVYGLDYWKEKAPEWYERRIVKQDKTISYWAMNRRLYDWWIRQIAEKAIYGHRYNCMFCAVVYAVKCGVPKEEVEADLMKLLPILTSRKENDPITPADVREALGAYSENLHTYPVKSIVYLSGIDIRQDAPRRNGRTQAEHLRGARALQEVFNPEWREGNGRKPKQDIVQAWRQEHPDGKKAQCIRDTGLSKPTVLKWWD